jgi:hypothetical protein
MMMIGRSMKQILVRKSHTRLSNEPEARQGGREKRREVLAGFKAVWHSSSGSNVEELKEVK